ncbi:uncharacterized protein C8A04DRAFT_28302 [Dichotomopilus funicola]|uniref:Uncharacterized protein n=1 Tax=Dichotomopilus funicola TaxID=1934379 RepID=A0AAN6V3U2_9PEZI|nr:hypothetical protein C8A04DRAFT_28302 [Dichotomopilus funicola]
MSFQFAVVPKRHIDVLLAYNDEEFGNFMKVCRQPGGRFDIELEGWDTLDGDSRERLLERLKPFRLGRDSSTERERASWPVDFDAVTTRLLDISNNNQEALVPAALEDLHSRIVSSPDTGNFATPLEDEIGTIRRSEAEAYNALLNEGGRPLYPLDLLEDVLHNTETHRETLLSWQKNPEPETIDTEVFHKQLWRWRAFWHWQKENRGIDGLEDELSLFTAEGNRREARKPERVTEEEQFAAFVNGIHQENLEHGRRWPGMTDDERRESYRSSVDSTRSERQYRFRRLRNGRSCREFAEYVSAVQRCLAKHHFTRPFQLNNDVEKRDPLTTCIEYLACECLWYDLYESLLQRSQSIYDKEWAELANSGILRRRETSEFLHSGLFMVRHQTKGDNARKAVKSAQEAGLAAVFELNITVTAHSKATKEEHRPRLANAYYGLMTADARLEEFKKRDDRISRFIAATKTYPRKQQDFGGQKLLSEWVLGQIPLVEAEMAALGQYQVQTNAESSDLGPRRSLRRSQQDMHLMDDNSSPKRKRESSNPPTALATASTSARKSLNRGTINDLDDVPPAKRLRTGRQQSVPSSSPILTNSTLRNGYVHSPETSHPRGFAGNGDMVED